jgi:acyl dehydratase
MALVAGAQASFTKTLGEIDLHGYAGLSGDQHPVHVDAAFARRTPYGTRVAHGAFLVALMASAASRLVTRAGETLLVPVSVDVRFRAPARLGDTVTARVRVLEVDPDGSASLDASCENQEGVQVAVGRLRLAPLHGRRQCHS